MTPKRLEGSRRPETLKPDRANSGVLRKTSLRPGRYDSTVLRTGESIKPGELKPEGETLVIEQNCDEAVGTDAEGIKSVQDYMFKIADILGSNTIVPPRTHNSPKYGLSGWAPFQEGEGEGRASHLYAWDHIGKSCPPFLSVDVSTAKPLSPKLQKKIIHVTIDHFKGKTGETVYKTSNAPLARSWKELAEHILRQRLKISGQSKEPIEKEEVSEYLKDLAPQLKMSRISEPEVIYDQRTGKGQAWVHWETSGVTVAWNNETGIVEIDIYTCREFDLGYAIDYTRRKLNKILYSQTQDF